MPCYACFLVRNGFDVFVYHGMWKRLPRLGGGPQHHLVIRIGLSSPLSTREDDGGRTSTINALQDTAGTGNSHRRPLEAVEAPTVPPISLPTLKDVPPSCQHF